ncbi:hypothetical protein Mapa_002908 [Marchantia paleacea]|nr:hypothetical protein Mapa_002908 [Marchantia paleacea]
MLKKSEERQLLIGTQWLLLLIPANCSEPEGFRRFSRHVSFGLLERQVLCFLAPLGMVTCPVKGRRPPLGIEESMSMKMTANDMHMYAHVQQFSHALDFYRHDKYKNLALVYCYQGGAEERSTKWLVRWAEEHATVCLTQLMLSSQWPQTKLSMSEMVFRDHVHVLKRRANSVSFLDS